MEESTDFWAALGMGLLQGITEFLPVSSSGHLAVFAMLAEVPHLSLAFMLLLHFATLLATVAMFRHDLWVLTTSSLAGLAQPRQFLTTEQGTLLRNLVAASVPTAIIGLFMKDTVEGVAQNPTYVAVGFLASAGVLISTRWTGGEVDQLSLRAALVVGAAQGLAVMPGLSRSGTTIACAMALGMRAPDAFRFSFLLSIPVIFGATLLELGHASAWEGLGASAWLAAGVALVSGYLSLHWLRYLVTGGRLSLFALYLIPLSAAMLLSQLTLRGAP